MGLCGRQYGRIYPECSVVVLLEQPVCVQKFQSGKRCLGQKTDQDIYLLRCNGYRINQYPVVCLDQHIPHIQIYRTVNESDYQCPDQLPVE